MTTNQTIDGVRRELLEQAIAREKVRPTLEGRNNTCVGCGNWMPYGHPEAHEHEDGCPEERSAERRHWVSQLRALLDAPAGERKAVKRYDRDSVAGHCDVEIALPEHKILHHDHGPNLAEALARLAGRVARFHKLEAPSLAAQPQGEPVAYADPKAFENFGSLAHLGGLYAREWMWANPAPGLVPLYAEQPAPVAVVLPDQKAVSALVTMAARQADLINGANYYTAAELAAEAVIDEVTRLNTKS